jgi:hypothetical protein
MVRDPEKTTDYTPTIVLDAAVRAWGEAEVERRNDGMRRTCGDSFGLQRGVVAAWYNRLLFLFSSPLIYPGMFGSAVLFA